MNKLKRGDKVRWELHRPNLGNRKNGKHLHGIGVLTKIFPPFGNVPWTCHVSGYRGGVLFADEVKRAAKR
jgi:hypothetical protein